MFEKTLDAAHEGFKECGHLMRVGTNSDVSLVTQSLTFGDRRLLETVLAFDTHSKLKYTGGMGIGKNSIEMYTELMKETTGLGWDYFFREKDEDEIFAWDIIDNGVHKDFLYKTYSKCKEAAAGPLMTEGLVKAPCLDVCTACGVCTNPKLQKMDKPDHTDDEKNIAEVLEYQKAVKTRVLRLTLDLLPEFRYIHSSKLKMRLRRACFNLGIPIRDNFIFASDKIIFQDWNAGMDVAEIYISDKRYEISEKAIMDGLNEYLDVMKITRVEQYSGNIKALRDNFEEVLYSVAVSTEEFTGSRIEEALEAYDKSEYFEVKVKVKGMMRDSYVIERYNAKDLVKDVWTKREGNDIRIYALLSENLSMYDFLPALLSTTKRRILKYPVTREEFLLKKQSDTVLDMFASTCEVCGEEIEIDIFGEDVDDNLCLRHKYTKE